MASGCNSLNRRNENCPSGDHGLFTNIDINWARLNFASIRESTKRRNSTRAVQPTVAGIGGMRAGRSQSRLSLRRNLQRHCEATAETEVENASGLQNNRRYFLRK